MFFPTTIGYIRQTALLLCGLLPYISFAQQRSTADATMIAHRFAHEKLTLLDKSHIGLKLASSAISANEELKRGKEAYYIFTSTTEETGFVIVSGDERMPDVLAYSESGCFPTDSIPPNVRYWLDCYEEAFLQVNGDCQPETYHSDTVNSEGVAPLLGNNEWGQSDPFNRLCPSVRNEKCVTGCVSTAMAQVMKYHRYPDKGKGSVSYYTGTNNIHVQEDFSSFSFQWDKMLDSYKRNFTQEEANSVAKLMFACGASVKMDYCTSDQGGSGAYQTDLVTAFVNHFNYDDDAAFMDRRYCSVEDWHQLLVNELNAGRPINYAGQSMRDGGHSFVIDGYNSDGDSRYPYYHVNWGWNGSCDGYYQIADLHPSDNGQHATYDGFNSNQQIAIGIKPEDGMDDGLIYVGTPNLYVSTSTAKAGNSLKVYTASCLNFSYKPFNGVLCVALIPMEEGSETILGEQRLKTLAYLQEQSNVSIEITLPSTMADGQYKIQLLSKQSGKDDYQLVMSRKYPVLTISSTGSIMPEEISEALLGSSELEALRDPDPTQVSLNIYELQNLVESPFIGDLKMILADKSGRQLCTFGDSIQPGELSTFEIQEKPIKIQGQLSGEWPDGDYKLYVGARQINTPKYVYLSFYDVLQPDMSYHELCLNSKIKDGRLIVDDKSYNLLPTTIERGEEGCILNNDVNNRIYRLDGRRYQKNSIEAQTLPRGIYLMYQRKSIRKIVK